MAGKKSSFLLLAAVFIATTMLLSAGFASASWYDWFKSITGRATSQPFNLSISLGNNAPTIPLVFPLFFTHGPIEDTVNYTLINFTASDTDGYGNLNDATAKINLSRGGESTRTNSTCIKYQQGGNVANYSCRLDMWYFDSTGVWNITAFIQDISAAAAVNTTDNLTYNQANNFVAGPAITFTASNPGATNVTSTGPLWMNNTGNKGTTAGNMQVNATNLRGETTSTQAIWAANMSIGANVGSSNVCNVGASGATGMVGTYAYTALNTANLTTGNHSLNDGNTGQEQLYFCIRTIGNELSSQIYSTLNNTESSWTVKVV